MTTPSAQALRAAHAVELVATPRMTDAMRIEAATLMRRDIKVLEEFVDRLLAGEA